MDEQGVASVKNIDRAIEVGTTHSIGPLQLSDLVGLDVRLNNAQYLREELGSVVSRPPKILQHLVAEGKLGKKPGQGFDQWE
jgi:3-hydroxybutyryl-CoA dehydrogenase